MRVGYNEIDPYCCAWLENLMSAGLIPIGKIFCRDIRDIRPDELVGFDQFHFLAGLGGWPYALELAGWDEPCWTGSCPCQPFSAAGKRKGFEDERHLWPAWRKLIEERRPAIIFGEQVARATEWLALVHGDLETLDYAVGCVPIEAASVGAPHIRDRIWFVADANSARRTLPERQTLLGTRRQEKRRAVGQCSQSLADTNSESTQWFAESRQESHSWPTEPDVGRVAHGTAARMDKLRALGNAIVPQVAATFVRAFMETRRG